MFQKLIQELRASFVSATLPIVMISHLSALWDPMMWQCTQVRKMAIDSRKRLFSSQQVIIKILPYSLLLHLGKELKDTITLKVDASQQYQEIFGFGGAFTDAAGINLNRLSETTRNTLLTQYFSKENGIGYTIGRVPMASCDFSTHEYSYDDVEGDMALDHFSLANEDFIYKIPYILQASELMTPGEELKLFSTPWSAPGWMKTSGEMKGAGQLKGDVNGDYYVTWANYFVK